MTIEGQNSTSVSRRYCVGITSVRNLVCAAGVLGLLTFSTAADPLRNIDRGKLNGMTLQAIVMAWPGDRGKRFPPPINSMEPVTEIATGKWVRVLLMVRDREVAEGRLNLSCRVEIFAPNGFHLFDRNVQCLNEVVDKLVLTDLDVKLRLDPGDAFGAYRVRVSAKEAGKPKTLRLDVGVKHVGAN